MDSEFSRCPTSVKFCFARSLRFQTSMNKNMRASPRCQRSFKTRARNRTKINEHQSLELKWYPFLCSQTPLDRFLKSQLPMILRKTGLCQICFRKTGLCKPGFHETVLRKTGFPNSLIAKQLSSRIAKIK